MHLKYVTFSRAENIANANFNTDKMYFSDRKSKNRKRIDLIIIKITG